MCKDKNNICSCIFNIIAGLLVGSGVAAIFFAGLVTSILTLVIITLILGALIIIAILLKGLCGRRRNCECIETSTLPASAIGAIITSIFALTIGTLTAGSVPTAILIGAIAFFLVSIIIGIVDFLICTFCSNRCYKD